MSDHEDASVAGMALGDPSQSPQHALLMRFRRLADELHPVALDSVQPFPGSPVLLA